MSAILEDLKSLVLWVVNDGTLFSASEPVSAILEDLKSLVPALLEDSLDSSDESQE